MSAFLVRGDQGGETVTIVEQIICKLSREHLKDINIYNTTKKLSIDGKNNKLGFRKFQFYFNSWCLGSSIADQEKLTWWVTLN